MIEQILKEVQEEEMESILSGNPFKSRIELFAIFSAKWVAKNMYVRLFVLGNHCIGNFV